MTTFEIILAVVVVILLIHHIVWGFRAAGVVTQHKKAMESQHPSGPPGDWPPEGLTFP